ncbi:MAG: hypothetical protein AAF346_02390 [Pseudomonadota bacterium]
MANDALAPALRFVTTFVASADVAAHLTGLRYALLDQLVPAAVGRSHGAILFHHDTALSDAHFAAYAAELLDAVWVVFGLRRFFFGRLGGECIGREPE